MVAAMIGGTVAFAGAIAAWAVSLANGLSSSLLQPLGKSHSTELPKELSALLSPGAKIYEKGSSGFQTATDRWITWKNPHLDIVVEVATEDDIGHTIRYANDNDKMFLAISGQHGANLAIAEVQHGVGIWMRGMTDVNISADGQSASIGGGITSGDLLRSLWTRGKHTVAGACECTGAVAPMLGGGHGWLQGRYGLAADNLISARLVLANGTIITVSDQAHPDLFWALRGAGHNYGIVSSFEYKIYDRTPENENWVVDVMIFTSEKLDHVYEEGNKIIGVNRQPVELIHMMMWSFNPDIDPVNPVILLLLLYQGKEFPKEYTEPFVKLQPAVHTSNSTNLPGIAPLVGFSNLDPACQHGKTLLRFPVNLERYNLAGLRNAFDIFSNISTPFRELSAVALEAYSMQGVQSVAPASTAYPDRQNNLLISPFIWYKSNKSLDESATSYGNSIRDALVNASGKPLETYVNYAYGDESQEALYGYEPWRLEKLRRLKALYDPHGRFSYYNPIGGI